MLKSEKAMSELLQKVAKECKSEDVKSQLKKLGSAFLNHREISAQESAYRLLSLPLKQATRKVVFINTSPEDKRVIMLKPPSQLQDLDDESEDLYQKSLLDRYSARPESLNDICLAEFAANYTVDYGDDDMQHGSDHQPDVTAEIGTSKCERIKLQNGMGTMHKRREEAVICFHREKEAGESKYRNLMILYFPWRNEDDDIIGGHQTYFAHYNQVKEIVHQNEAKYTSNVEAIDRALQDIDDDGPPEHVWDQLAPGAQQQAADQQAEGPVIERDVNIESENPDIYAGQNDRQQSVLQGIFSTEASKQLLSPHEYRSMMRSLNEKQKEK